MIQIIEFKKNTNTKDSYFLSYKVNLITEFVLTVDYREKELLKRVFAELNKSNKCNIHILDGTQKNNYYLN